MGTRLAPFLSLALASLSTGCGDDITEPRPYGGEVRIVQTVYPDGTEWLSTTAFFIADQDPEAAPEVPLGECDFVPRSEQAPSRQYLDVGDSVTFHVGGQAFVAPREENVADFLGRQHDIFYRLETWGDGVPADILMREDSARTAEPQSFSDQLRVLHPPAMHVDIPDSTDGFVTVSRDEDLDITWQQEEPVDDLTIVISLYPVDTTGPALTCRVPDTGRFAVPREALTALDMDAGMITIYSVRRATVLTDSWRAIDLRAEYHGSVHPVVLSSGSE